MSILLKSSQWCNFASVCNYFVYTQSDLFQKCFLNTHKHILLATIRVHYFANFLPVIFAICLDLSFCSKHHNILDFWKIAWKIFSCLPSMFLRHETVTLHSEQNTSIMKPRLWNCLVQRQSLKCWQPHKNKTTSQWIQACL